MKKYDIIDVDIYNCDHGDVYDILTEESKVARLISNPDYTCPSYSSDSLSSDSSDCDSGDIYEIFDGILWPIHLLI